MPVFVCVSPINVPRLTSPLVLKLLDSRGYPWLSYYLAKVIKVIGETFEQFFFSSKKYLVSFLLYYCHSFCIIVIPSVLLSFLLYYCNSFQIIVIPNSSQFPPIPEGRENWTAEPAMFASSNKKQD